MPSPRYLYKDTELKAIPKNMVVLVDTREKENSHIITHFEQSKVQYQPYALSFGDYSVMLPEMPDNGIMRSTYFDKSIAIERKANLDELSGNLTGERQRFENEFIRAGNARKYLLVEGASYDMILFHAYNTKLSEKALFASLLSFQERYNLNVCFAAKETAGQIISGLLYYHLREYLTNN